MELEDKQSEAPRTKPFRSQMFHIAIHDQSVEEKNNLSIDGVTKWNRICWPCLSKTLILVFENHMGLLLINKEKEEVAQIGLCI